jgi:serine/threonine protein phosphatase 1
MPSPGRIIAIGDIHGYWAALSSLLEAIDPTPSDTIVPLGDFIDRGPQSPQVLDELIRLEGRCRLVPILGNHDEMLLSLYEGAPGFEAWLSFGGAETLAAYGCKTPREVPAEHIAFLRRCVSYLETERHFFVHASYVPDLPLEAQPLDTLRWSSIRRNLPGPHRSGKTAVLGHTAQRDGRILDLGYLICLDTCCYCGNCLTAMDITSGEVWQATPEGTICQDEDHKDR